jgi:tight adherence protein C
VDFIVADRISLLLGQALLFAAIVLITYGIMDFLSIRTGIGRRLHEKIFYPAALSAKGFGHSLDEILFKRYEKYLTPSSEEDLSAIRWSLTRAGYRSQSDVRLFYGFRILLAAVALLAGITVLPVIMIKMQTNMIILAMLPTVLIGFFIPALWIERTYQSRRSQIRDSFPDVLDLLLVCIEAGHGFDQALNRVVSEMATSSPVLADELLMVTREIRAGKDRHRVLADFADRTGIDDIKSFITVLRQADKFGVSIAQALRVYSSEMRDKRYARAEEKANMMPIKLALGAIVFTVPPAIIVMVVPSVIMVVQNLGGMK